jgi:peptide/nickel transport system permease protein
MPDKNADGLADEHSERRAGGSRDFFRGLVARRIVIFGMIVVVILVITAIFGPWIAPYQPNETDVQNTHAGPSAQHWLGTDSVGRDTFSRLIYGARTSMLVSLVALAVAAILGVGLGLIAGYFGKMTYAVIMRIMDAMMTVPMILMALTIAAVLGSGLVNVIIALGIALVPAYARLMCGQVLSVRENEYVSAARSVGASNTRIMLRHVLPNCLAPLIVMMTLQLGTTILAEAGLSFLGVGVQPPTASWGSMVSDGYQYLSSDPLLSLLPGFAIMLVVFSFNMVGDGLRDALDPRLRNVI